MNIKYLLFFQLAVDTIEGNRYTLTQFFKDKFDFLLSYLNRRKEQTALNKVHKTGKIRTNVRVFVYKFFILWYNSLEKTKEFFPENAAEYFVSWYGFDLFGVLKSLFYLYFRTIRTEKYGLILFIPFLASGIAVLPLISEMNNRIK